LGKDQIAETTTLEVYNLKSLWSNKLSIWILRPAGRQAEDKQLQPLVSKIIEAYDFPSIKMSLSILLARDHALA
jgi:hypothetical protein